MDAIKRGTTFTHRNWKNTAGGPITCVVTAVRNGVVYWRELGDSKSRHFFDIIDADKYVISYFDRT